jgi:hypothetical protein
MSRAIKRQTERCMRDFTLCFGLALPDDEIRNCIGIGIRMDARDGKARNFLLFLSDSLEKTGLARLST